MCQGFQGLSCLSYSKNWNNSKFILLSHAPPTRKQHKPPKNTRPTVTTTTKTKHHYTIHAAYIDDTTTISTTQHNTHTRLVRSLKTKNMSNYARVPASENESRPSQPSVKPGVQIVLAGVCVRVARACGFGAWYFLGGFTVCGGTLVL